MGELKQHNMKTLLLLSILGLALVSADLQTEEDRYTEEADVVAVDDSAEAMDDLDDNTRRNGYQSLSAKFRFGDDLTADIKVRQSNSEKEKNNARWPVELACPPISGIRDCFVKHPACIAYDRADRELQHSARTDRVLRQ